MKDNRNILLHEKFTFSSTQITSNSTRATQIQKPILMAWLGQCRNGGLIYSNLTYLIKWIHMSSKSAKIPVGCIQDKFEYHVFLCLVSNFLMLLVYKKESTHRTLRQFCYLKVMANTQKCRHFQLIPHWGISFGTYHDSKWLQSFTIYPE